MTGPTAHRLLSHGTSHLPEVQPSQWGRTLDEGPDALAATAFDVGWRSSARLGRRLGQPRFERGGVEDPDTDAREFGQCGVRHP